VISLDPVIPDGPQGRSGAWRRGARTPETVPRPSRSRLSPDGRTSSLR